MIGKMISITLDISILFCLYKVLIESEQDAWGVYIMFTCLVLAKQSFSDVVCSQLLWEGDWLEVTLNSSCSSVKCTASSIPLSYT